MRVPRAVRQRAGFSGLHQRAEGTEYGYFR